MVVILPGSLVVSRVLKENPWCKWNKSIIVLSMVMHNG